MNDQKGISGQPSHLPYLDGIRGLAAFYVVLHHAWLYRGKDPEWLGLLLAHGREAVTIFFVLSGTVLMLPVAKHGGLRGGLRDYGWRRIKRILPPYYAAFILGWLWLAWLPTSDHYRSLAAPFGSRAIVTHALLLQGFDGESYFKIQPILWSVSQEWVLYWLFPAILIPLYRLAGAGGVLVMALSNALVPPLPLGHGFLAWPLLSFAFGISTACLIAEKVRPWKVLAPAFLAPVALYLIPVEGRMIGWEDATVGAGAMLLFWSLASPRLSRARAAFEWRPLIGLASISYSLYLWHPPVLATFTDPRWGVPLSILAATISAALFEWPFQRARKSAGPGRSSWSAAEVNLHGRIACVPEAWEGKPLEIEDGGSLYVVDADEALLAACSELFRPGSEVQVKGRARPLAGSPFDAFDLTMVGESGQCEGFARSIRLVNLGGDSPFRGG